MKRTLVLIACSLIACAAVTIYIGTLRPFAPDPRSPGVTATAELHVSGEIAIASGTPTTGMAVAMVPSPVDTATSSATPLQAIQPRRTRTPAPTRTATSLDTPDVHATETAVPANETLGAIATRAFATFTPTPGPSPTPRAIDSTTNFLLLGSDLRPDDPKWVPSTDVIMVVFVDNQNGRAAVLSFPRDLVVAIPGYDAFRINYVWHTGEREHGPGGGAELVKRVLHDEYGIHIDHWAMVDLNGYQKIIDTLGGIDLHVACTLQDTIDQQSFSIPAGDVHMDALTARRYIQSRYSTSDTSRNLRQQRVLYAMLKKGLSIGALDKIPALWAELHDVVKTDMSVLDMVGLLPIVRSIDPINHPERIHAAILEYPQVYPFVSDEGAWLYMPDYALIEKQMSNIFDAPPMERPAPDRMECPPITITPEPTSTASPTTTPGAP